MKIFLKTTLKVVIFFIGWAVCCSFADIPTNNPAIWRLGAELIPLLVIVLFTLVFWLIEKRSITIPILNNFRKGSLIGLITGIAWIGIATILLIILRCEKIVGTNQVNSLWIWVIAAFLNTIMQELLVRGYIYQLVKKEYNIIPAIVVTTALFTFCHGGALEAGIIPVLNVITMSLFATAIYEYTGTLMAPIMAHATWNIIGSIILGGVSLADDYPKLFHMVASGNPLISGGDYMIEGSIIVLFLNIALSIFFWKKFMAIPDKH